MRNLLRSLFAKFPLRVSASHGLRVSTNSSASASHGLPVSTKSWASAWLAGREDTLPGHSLLTNALEQSSWIYACVTTLAETVSSIPFRFVDAKNSEPRIVNPELETLFNRPHP